MAVGHRQYEISNHLGNVLSTVSDRKKSIDLDGNGTTDIYDPVIKSATFYHPFGQPLAGLDYAYSEYRYQFNGKERDEMTGLQDYGFRSYDQRVGRFMSVDPLASQRTWTSPYNFVQNSPLWRVDPTGAIDTIGISAQGVVEYKIPAEGKHVFIDIPSGQELFLNDPTGADENISDAWYIEKGDKFLTRLESSEVSLIAKSGSLAPYGLRMEGRILDAYALTKKLSVGGPADFPLKLKRLYGLRSKVTDDDILEIVGTHFLVEGESTIYNPSDFGQYIWGAWMQYNSYTRAETWLGSNINEASSGGDAEGDQRAIFNGFDSSANH